MFSTWMDVMGFTAAVIAGSVIYEVIKALKTNAWRDIWHQPVVTGLVTVVGSAIIKVCS